MIGYSHPIRDDPGLDHNSYFIRQGNFNQVTGNASAAGGFVTIHTVAKIADLGPDVVSFSPPPFDVLSDTTRPIPAPAFTDFPLV